MSAIQIFKHVVFSVILFLGFPLTGWSKNPLLIYLHIPELTSPKLVKQWSKQGHHWASSSMPELLPSSAELNGGASLGWLLKNALDSLPLDQSARVDALELYSATSSLFFFRFQVEKLSFFINSLEKSYEVFLAFKKETPELLISLFGINFFQNDSNSSPVLTGFEKMVLLSSSQAQLPLKSGFEGDSALLRGKKIITRSCSVCHLGTQKNSTSVFQKTFDMVSKDLSKPFVHPVKPYFSLPRFSELDQKAFVQTLQHLQNFKFQAIEH